MKKLMIVLILALILTACGTDTTDASAPAAEAPEVTEAAAPETTEAPATEATEPPATEAPATQDLGTRKNPVEFGETVVMEAEYDGDPIVFEITLSDLVRGEEAYDRMISANQFNEVDDDEEVLFASVEFKLIEYDNVDDKPVWTSYRDFDYYKSDYSSYQSDNHIVIDNPLSGDTYEGGSLTGSIGVIVPEGESGYLLFNNLLWFKIPE